MADLKRMTKLQRYAASLVKNKDSDIIQSKSTNSAYYNFNGNRVRISDHLPAEHNADVYGMALSIISTPDDNIFVVQTECTGFVEVITYRKAQEILRSFNTISNLVKRPEHPFMMEREFYENGFVVDGLPTGTLSKKSLSKIKSAIQEAKQEIIKKSTKQEIENKKMKKI